MTLERRTTTSFPEVFGSLILWAKIPVGPRPCVSHRPGREGENCHTHWLPHTTLDLTTKRNDWGWATDLKHEARTPNPEPRTPNPEPRTPEPEPRSPDGTCTTVNTEKVVEGGWRLHRIVLSHYFTLLKFPNICLLVICVQLKVSELSLSFIRGIFHSDSLVPFLTGFNDGQYCRVIISSLFLKNFMHELVSSV